MMAVLRVIAALALSLVDGGVERGTDGAPVAFRIWRAGENATDYGVHVFSKRSAELLMADQALRGNRYSIDVDHLSLSKGPEAATPEARKAVGFHRLAVRDGKDGLELWATELEWTDIVKPGLTKQPPEWRYFSPAYDVDKKSGEIVGYLNTALTNNPATHRVTELANRSGPMTDYAAIAAALFGEDEEKKKEAKAAIAAMSEEDRAKCKAAIAAAFGEGEGGPGEKEKKEKEEAARDAAAAKASAEEEEKKKKEEAARTAAASTRATAEEKELFKTVGEQGQRLAELEAKEESAQRQTMLASRPDLSAQQRDYLVKQPLAKVKELLAAFPKAPEDPAAAARATATRGSTQRSRDEQVGAVRAMRSTQLEADDIAARFGRHVNEPRIHFDGNELVLPQITRAEAERVLAARAKQGPPPRGASWTRVETMAAVRGTKGEAGQ